MHFRSLNAGGPDKVSALRVLISRFPKIRVTQVTLCVYGATTNFVGPVEESAVQ